MLKTLDSLRAPGPAPLFAAGFFDPKPKTSSLSGVINKPRDIGNVTQYE